jgi:transcriptional regulator of arginine metabolism
MRWRNALHNLLENEAHGTQGSLVRALERQGHFVTQASVSRELAAVGAVKEDGVYRLGPPPALAAPVHGAEIAYGGGVCIVHTDPAHASVLAQAIDDASVEGVLGTIAGDNAVLVVLAHPDAFGRLCRRLRCTARADA